MLIGKEDYTKLPKERKMLFEGTDDPDGLSCYQVMIKFDERLIEQYNLNEVKTVESLMDNVPIFCGCHRFRKLMWEEFHNPVPKGERLHKMHSFGRQNAIRNNMPLSVIHDALSDESYDGVRFYEEEGQSPATSISSPLIRYKNSKQVQRAIDLFDRKDVVSESQGDNKVRRIIK